MLASQPEALKNGKQGQRNVELRFPFPKSPFLRRLFLGRGEAAGLCDVPTLNIGHHGVGVRRPTGPLLRSGIHVSSDVQAT